MRTGQIATGIVMCIAGIVLALTPLFYTGNSGFLFEVYGIPILAIGIFIFFNKEDRIEKIKTEQSVKTVTENPVVSVHE